MWYLDQSQGPEKYVVELITFLGGLFQSKQGINPKLD